MGRSPVAFNRAVSYIEETGGEFTIQSVADHLGISVPPVTKACRHLVAEGFLNVRKRGRTHIFYHGKVIDAVKSIDDVDFKPIDKPIEDFVIPPSKKPVVQKASIPVKEQFEMISHITGMVLDGTAPSFLLTGMAGIGKTYQVRQELADRGLQKDVDYQWVSGQASPLGLYRVLHNNRNGIVIFDDCDDVLKRPGSMNILKAALDLYKTRVISWPSKTVTDQGLDEHFEFTGQVIFISNLDFSTIADALTSRAFKVDVFLTPEQVIEKIGLIIEDITPNGIQMSMEYKQDALEAMLELKDEILALGKNLDIRAFEKACLLRKSAGEHGWDEVKRMIKYQI